MMSFGARLHAAVGVRGPLCVGIDPHRHLLEDWGLPDSPAGLARFAHTAVEAIAPEVAVVKPQSAFFERYGSKGIAVLERVIADCREAGALVLLDVKRGDIGSTSQAYADAYLDPASPLAADAITASPYLGFGSLEPMLTTAQAHAAGVFVLGLTSNKEAPQVQLSRTAEGDTVAGTVFAELARRNAGQQPLGSFGAVVGATIGDTTEDLGFNGPILVPGYGAQGGTVADLRRIFAPVLAAGGVVLPSTSRGVLSAGPQLPLLRAAVEAARAEVAGLTGS